MADAVAITGIIVSGVVGPGFAALYASRRLEREHDFGLVATDRAEARAILDATTEHLQRAGRLRSALYPLLLTHGASTAQRASEHMERLHDAARTVDLDTGRLELRFGYTAQVVEAHRQARDAIVIAVDAVVDAGRLGDHADLRETNAALKRGREAFDAAELLYMAAAHQLARAHLVPPKRRSLRPRR